MKEFIPNCPDRVFDNVLNSHGKTCKVLKFEPHHFDPNRYNKDREKDYMIRCQFEKEFNKYVDKLITIYGKPNLLADGWEVGVPTFASAGLYSEWLVGNDLVCIFVNMDNSGDPTFLVLAKCPVEEVDYTPGACNPWDNAWYVEVYG